ncbi:hypothetical protein O181_089499 [Austropuccinia psidii MF-1]|uniref:Uncharacterized protein n=1 Tax=Austropuccinia psidii MF-1 TaxID=1389203 RepID=A0A9Q3P5N4_9BASI|nr:hypothetical protein [Austropuccinia psidii MF-1]
MLSAGITDCIVTSAHLKSAEQPRDLFYTNCKEDGDAPLRPYVWPTEYAHSGSENRVVVRAGTWSDQPNGRRSGLNNNARCHIRDGNARNNIRLAKVALSSRWTAYSVSSQLKDQPPTSQF